MSNSRIDLVAGERTPQPQIEPLFYARPGHVPAIFPVAAEPEPPGHDDRKDVVNPAERLECCLDLLTRATSVLEGGVYSVTEVVALLKAAIQQERALGKDILALQKELESLRTGRDILTVALNRAEALSITDDLTGLPNRRAFLQRLGQEISRSQRTHQPLSVVLLDMDNFKNINDRFGHHAGDQVLRSYAQRIAREFRQHDLSARYGGEEFVLLFPMIWPDEARRALEKLRRQIGREPLVVGDANIAMPTFSAGIATLRAGESGEALLNRADQALYRAKRMGRNRTESDEPLPARPTS